MSSPKSRKELEGKINLWVEQVNRDFELERHLDEALAWLKLTLQNRGDLHEWVDLVHNRKTKLEKDAFKMWTAIRCAKGELKKGVSETTGRHCLSIGILMGEVASQAALRTGKNKSPGARKWKLAEEAWRKFITKGEKPKAIDILEELPLDIQKSTNLASFKATLSAKVKNWERSSPVKS
jgi:hypothetical protein